MQLNKIKVLKVYKITDITNEYSEYSQEKKLKYRSSFSDDMILYEPLYKVVCKIKYNRTTEIVTRIWSKSELELIEKNKYYLG